MAAFLATLPHSMAGSTLVPEERNVSLGESIKSYVWWTHPRGGFHYDVMVTVILAFIFLTPSSVFKDKPQDRRPKPGQIVITPDGQDAFIYDLNASAVSSGGSDVQSSLKKAIEAVAGPVDVTSYQEQRDKSGKITGYRVRAHRQ
jgi:hypothetical protein